MGGVPSVGGLYKGSEPVFTGILKKTTENFERVGRQAQPRIEHGTSRQPISKAEPLSHSWGQGRTV